MFKFIEELQTTRNVFTQKTPFIRMFLWARIGTNRLNYHECTQGKFEHESLNRATVFILCHYCSRKIYGDTFTLEIILSVLFSLEARVQPSGV